MNASSKNQDFFVHTSACFVKDFKRIDNIILYIYYTILYYTASKSQFLNPDFYLMRSHVYSVRSSILHSSWLALLHQICHWVRSAIVQKLTFIIIILILQKDFFNNYYHINLIVSTLKSRVLLYCLIITTII